MVLLLVINVDKEFGIRIGAALKETIEALRLRVELDYAKHFHFVFGEYRFCLTHQAAKCEK